MSNNYNISKLDRGEAFSVSYTNMP